jgi:hypothetical protein
MLSRKFKRRSVLGYNSRLAVRITIIAMKEEKIYTGGKGETDYLPATKLESEKVTNGDAQSWWEPF